MQTAKATSCGTRSKQRQGQRHYDGLVGQNQALSVRLDIIDNSSSGTRSSSSVRWIASNESNECSRGNLAAETSMWEKHAGKTIKRNESNNME